LITFATARIQLRETIHNGTPHPIVVAGEQPHKLPYCVATVELGQSYNKTHAGSIIFLMGKTCL
jgi:hypothetical protein